MEVNSFDNKIIIINDGMKDSLLRLLSSKLINYKIITLSELKSNYYFSYDKEAIYYVSKKLSCVFDIAKSYIENLYYIGDVDEEKMAFLSDLKSELDKKGLLYYNPLFKSYFKDKDVILLDLDYCDKFYKSIFNDLNSLCNVESVSLYTSSNTKPLYKCLNSNEELSFVCTKICNLIKSGVSINNIKLTNVSSEYYYDILKYFKMFNIPINLSNNASINGSILVNVFKSNYSSDINSTLDKVYECVCNESDLYVYKKLLSLVNSYSFIDDYELVKPLIFSEINNIKGYNEEFDNAVRIIDFESEFVSENDHVFLIGYNEGIIPTSYMDDDYLSDKTKSSLGISTSFELNENNILNIRGKILGINNMYVSYSCFSNKSSLFISSSYDKDIFYEEEVLIDYSNSNSFNKSRLTIYKDEYKKYGSLSNDLILLNSRYPTYPYMSYSNKFNGLNEFDLNNSINLSYTSMNTYYECAFKYYLNYVLRLNNYEESFEIVVGNLFHKVLSICFSDDFNFEDSWNSEVSKISYSFSNSELFFLNKLKSELVLTIEIIKKQLKYTSLNDFMYEKEVKIEINRDLHITFKGYIDKLMYRDNGINTIVVIVDYKTGNPDININNSIYGLDMQLPIYMYLVKNGNMFDNVRIGGLYLQKILNNKSDEDKESSMKLEGYSNSDEEVLSLVDSSYSSSNLIKSMKMTNNGFYAFAKILSDEEMDYLSNLAYDKILGCAHDINSAKFDINPKVINNVNKGCAFCKYKDICYVKNDDYVNLLYKKISFGGDDNA